MKALITLFLIVFVQHAHAEVTYHVARVDNAKTIYEPKAQHLYEITELQSLSRSDTALPSSFAVNEVITNDTVIPGNWILVRFNSITNTLNIIDVADPNFGFIQSEAFWQIFYEKLRDMLAVSIDTIGLHRSRFVISIFVLNDGQIQLKYEGKTNNLLTILTDYYVREISRAYTPFLKANDEKQFGISSTQHKLVAYSVSETSVERFLNKVIDPDQPLPPKIKQTLKDRASNLTTTVNF
jgi:hypothetical protein